MNACCVVLAAGRGERMGRGENKLLLPLAGKTPLYYTLLHVKQAGCFSSIVIVCRTEERDAMARIAVSAGIDAPIFADGGDTRQDSALNGILAAPQNTEIVAMQDGARCFSSPELFRACVKSCNRFRSGVAGRRATDTVKRADEEGVFLETLNREELVLVETPQVFYKQALLEAYRKAQKDGTSATDDAGLMERMGHAVKLVPTCGENFKLTHSADFERAERLLMKEEKGYRVGQGYDIHAFGEDGDLLLCGVKIPHTHGFVAHSDGDVLAHAIIDALLGGAGLGDIGELFPDTDAKYEDADSMLLLNNVANRVREAGFAVVNMDVTLFMEQPKLTPYKRKIREAVADSLGLNQALVNIKAKTMEGFGAIGTGRAAAASVTCLLKCY